MTDENSEQGLDEPVDNTEIDSQAESDTAPKVDDSYIETDNDRVQARINKLTADKYAEKRRADELQQKLDTQVKVTPDAKEPKIEDFNYDEQAHMNAQIDYRVNQKALEIQKQQQTQINEAKTQEATQDLLNQYTKKVPAFKEKNTDYEVTISQLPEFPAEIYTMLLKSGPSLIYGLGKNLDVAFEIASMDPMSAAMKIGELSAQNSAKAKTAQAQSNSSDPIKPINSGGTVTDNNDVPGVTFS